MRSRPTPTNGEPIVPYYVQLTPDVLIALSALSATEHTAKLDAECRDVVVLGGTHAAPGQSLDLSTQETTVSVGTQSSLL
ncbi:TPA: hypothetical protein VDB83_005133 [Burkholderia cenocepacia]|nr:hypothetical protein [Burkholderia cenocepacia]